MTEQFLKGKTLLSWVLAIGEFQQHAAHGALNRRVMQELDGIGKGRKAKAVANRLWNPVDQRVALNQHTQCLIDERAQAGLLQSFGDRVDRRQMGRYLPFLIRRDELVFRMVHLQSGFSGAHLAVAADAGAGCESILLDGAEVEEAQRDDAARILDTAQQAAAAPEDQLSGQHLAFQHQLGAHATGRDRADSGAILITQWQVKE